MYTEYIPIPVYIESLTKSAIIVVTHGQACHLLSPYVNSHVQEEEEERISFTSNDKKEEYHRYR